MGHLRLFSLALTAASMLAVMLLPAKALALPTILPTTITTGTGKNIGSVTLIKANGETIECSTGRGENGTVESNRHLGLFHASLEGCKALGSITCTGLGEAAGVVLKLGSWHLVYDTLGASLSNDGVAVLALVATVHFSCGLELLTEKGMGLCLVLNPTALTKVFEMHCNKAVGANRPDLTKYYNEAGTLVSITGELVSTNEGAFEEGVVIGLGTIESPEAALIML